jgi:alpha-galactosidase
MAKIAFIGAGSFGFTRTLVKDVLTYPLLEDSTIALMDINSERLKYVTRAVNKIVGAGKYPTKVVSTMNREEALKGADVVMCTILAGGVDVWQYDIKIPKKYGIDFNVGDTRGIAGIFRALRTIPVMLDICRDIERLCPNAIMLNYTNPMAMLCNAMQRATKVTVTGLCHSVQGMPSTFAKWLGIPDGEIDYLCAGINHQAWYLELKHKGKDLYPQLKKVVKENKKIYNEELVRNEMFLQLGYYVTESSGHNSEYSWWFRKRDDLIKKYCSPAPGAAWNPGEYAFILNDYANREKNQKWQKDIQKWLDDPNVDIKRGGHEYAASIANAWMGGELFGFYGNVPNQNLITNLPKEACVEVPVFASRGKLNCVHVGELPIQLAALNNVSAATEIMTVNASLSGDPEMAFHACAYDPMCAAKLSLAEIRKLTQEMLNKNKAYLPQFKSVKI